MPAGAIRWVALALFIQDGVGFAATLLAQLNPVFYGLLALGYAYFLFIRPDAA